MALTDKAASGGSTSIRTTGVRSGTDARQARRPAPAARPKYAVGSGVSSSQYLSSALQDLLDALKKQFSTEDYQADTRLVGMDLARQKADLRRNFDLGRQDAALDAAAVGGAWSPALLGRQQGLMRADFLNARAKAKSDAGDRLAALERAYRREQDLLDAASQQRALLAPMGISTVIGGQ